MKLHKPGTIVLVEWFDAESIDAWGDARERVAQHRELEPVWTVGIVMSHTEKSIIITRSYIAKNHTLEGSFQIPMGMIHSIKKWNIKVLDVNLSEDD